MCSGLYQTRKAIRKKIHQRNVCSYIQKPEENIETKRIVAQPKRTWPQIHFLGKNFKSFFAESNNVAVCITYMCLLFTYFITGDAQVEIKQKVHESTNVLHFVHCSA